MAKFSESWMDELLRKNDIVSVVSDYVLLSQAGRNMKGLCPFHNEKTPSFSVSPEKNVYHCFGCKAGGGVIQFIMGTVYDNIAYAAPGVSREAVITAAKAMMRDTRVPRHRRVHTSRPMLSVPNQK